VGRRASGTGRKLALVVTASTIRPHAHGAVLSQTTIVDGESTARRLPKGRVELMQPARRAELASILAWCIGVAVALIGLVSVLALVLGWRP
jgi:hypothetical protein